MVKSKSCLNVGGTLHADLIVLPRLQLVTKQAEVALLETAALLGFFARNMGHLHNDL